MSGRRIFSNDRDATYNNFYNNRINKKLQTIDPIKPPITVVQASSSYRYEGEHIKKNCNNNGFMYPYGHYSFPMINPPVVPPIEFLVEQAVLEYGVANFNNICHTPVSSCLGVEEEGVDACIGMVEHVGHIGHVGHAGQECHVGQAGHIGINNDFQIEMELLKNYRFKCYECINPCCSANMLALQMIRESRSTRSGTVMTTMTYGSTGTTTTTTTTVKL
jgi:hypothetical protein